MYKIIRYTISSLAFVLLLSSCGTQPLTPANGGKGEFAPLLPDEAYIVVRLKYLKPHMGYGVLAIHPDGPIENPEKTVVRPVENWLPLFKLGTDQSEIPLLFKVKAGRMIMTSYSRGTQRAYLKGDFAFAKPGTITYVGDVNLRVTPYDVGVDVLDDRATIELMRQQIPSLFEKYPVQVYLFKKDR